MNRMPATVELPDAVLRQLEALARQEGSTAADLIRRLIGAHLNRSQPATERKHYVRLPLILASETGPIQAVTGAEVDETTRA